MWVMGVMGDVRNACLGDGNDGDVRNVCLRVMGAMGMSEIGLLVMGVIGKIGVETCGNTNLELT